MHTVFMLACLALLPSLAAAVEINGVPVPVCGGFPGFACSADQYCDFPAGTICGDADQFGTCRPRPQNCFKIYLPVCGCDGVTHPNACDAAAKGTDVAYPGPCHKE